MLRRVVRRMQVTRTEGLENYCNFLRDNSEEAQALLADLLISVTTFFRDSEVFAALKTQVIPQIFAAKKPTDAIRVWVPGCATGEEAYTLAICLLEFLQAQLTIALSSDDLVEGVTAFFEKREPRWMGR